MIGPYLKIFEAPGSRAFSAAGFLARMPLSMLGIGIVLLISRTDGQFGVAGAVAATYWFVRAVFSPMQGRLVDRLGQARVAVPAAGVCAAGLAALLILVLRGAPTWTYFVSVAVAGAAMPNVGTLVRARWAAVFTGTPQLHTAYSLESVVDEMVFLLGPPLVTALTVQVARAAGLLTALACMLVGTVVFGSLKRTEPTPLPGLRRTSRSVFGIGGIRILVAVFIGLGCMFGSIEVVTVAFAQQRGRPGVAGLLLGLYAAGSLVAGLVFGTRKPKRPLRLRLLFGLTGTVLAAVPLLIITDLGTFAIAMALAGLAISPTLITGFALAEFLVPAEQLTEGLALVSTGLALGITIGSAAAGYLIDSFGAHRSYLLSLSAAVVALLFGAAGNALLGRPRLGTDPAPA